MRRTTVLLGLVTSAAVAAGSLTGGTAAADPPGAVAVASAERGAPGSWTRLSTAPVRTTSDASLLRTADGVLHAVYPTLQADGDHLHHTAVSASGATVSQSEIVSGWSAVDAAPALVAGPGGGLRALFGGLRNSDSMDPYTNGRMITSTAPADGATWTLQSVYAGTSTTAYGSYGTAGTTLADGTPVAAYPLNGDVHWHVGTGNDPDGGFSVASCCVYDLAMVRSGDAVWLAWYGNGSTPATNGTFVRQIEPVLGPVLKAPGSSIGTDSLQTGRVALAARAGGGVYAAFCTGYPTCAGIRLWKVGAPSALAVPGSAGMKTLGLSAAPGGRLWVAWSDASATVKASRTNAAATRFGAVRSAGRPAGTSSVYSLSVAAGTARGDVVINTGQGLWHTQLVPGLSLQATPTTWRSGTKKKVRFTATDAGAPLAGVRVVVSGKRCTTASSGRCTIAFPKKLKPGRRTATGTLAGYGAGGVVLKVTKPKKKKKHPHHRVLAAG